MNILVTGAYGFLGRHVAAEFAKRGHLVLGCGRGAWDQADFGRWGLSRWYEGDVSKALLGSVEYKVDVIVHCAGGGSVAAANNDPIKDFNDTVGGLYEVLEFIRIDSPNTRLIYPSSPAVQGSHNETPFKVDDELLPVSLYGFHKKQSEDLCAAFRCLFNLDIFVVRLFSVYGSALRKQLLWDACNKLMAGNEVVEFWGAGSETRDFVHVIDVAELFIQIASSQVAGAPRIINCGSGKAITVKALVEKLRDRLGVSVDILFNGQSKPGDPRYYQACLDESCAFSWVPKVDLDDGLDGYVSWFLNDK